jgi:hypothetical protein
MLIAKPPPDVLHDAQSSAQHTTTKVPERSNAIAFTTSAFNKETVDKILHRALPANETLVKAHRDQALTRQSVAGVPPPFMPHSPRRGLLRVLCCCKQPFIVATQQWLLFHK